MFTGVGTALVTPFTKSGDLDESRVRRLGRRQIDARHPLPRALRHDRREPDADRRRAARGSSRSSSTKRAARCRSSPAPAATTRRRSFTWPTRCGSAGASGLLSVTPYYNKPTQEGLYQHYRAIAESTPLPIVVYNVPGRTGVNVEPATLARLAAIPNIVGVKEASGNMTQMCEVCRAVPPDFIVLSGDDALTLPLMAVGGRGVISVASNEIPAEMVQMVEAAERERLRRGARDSRAHPAADAGQLRRSEPDPGEGGDGGDGPARRGLPAADGAAASRSRARRSCKVLKELGSAEGALCSNRVRTGLEPAESSQSEIEMLEIRASMPLVDRRRRPPIATRRARRSRELREALSAGTVRAAEPDRVEPDRLAREHLGEAGDSARLPVRRPRRRLDGPRPLPFYDKDTLPLKRPGLAAGVRIVPGGSAIRDGAYLAPGVICMPPMYVNIGAWVGEPTRSSTRTRSSDRARRWARACTSAPARRSAASSSRSARCRSSSKTRR